MKPGMAIVISIMTIAFFLTMPASMAANYVSTAERQDFSCVQSLLEKIVNYLGKKGVQHLYISPVERGKDKTYMYVYWPEDDSILTINLPVQCAAGQSTENNFDLSWYDRKGRINLKTDVVPAHKDIGSSTYLVDRSWVNRVIKDCRENGYLLVIQ